MKNVSKMFVALTLIVSISLTACHTESEVNRRIDEVRNEYGFELERRDSTISNLMASITEIENNLLEIKARKKILTEQSESKELSKTKKNQILEDIAVLNSLIDESRNKAIVLQKRLKDSGVKIKEFESKITELNVLLAEKDNDIETFKQSLAERDFAIADLNKKVDTLRLDLNSKNELIVSKDNDLNKAFVTVGNYEDLKQKGVITKEGGFLGLGKTKEIVGNLPKSQFNTVDIRSLNSLPIQSKNAELITKHPEGSYQLVKSDDGDIVELAIINPEEFWKTSRYLVVEVK